MQYIRVHMGPGNYGLFPVYFLPIFWPHCSLFRRKKCVQLIIYKILPSFFIRFTPSSFHIYYGLGQFNDLDVGYNDVGLCSSRGAVQ